MVEPNIQPDKFIEVENISIQSLNAFFSDAALKCLQKAKITNLKELFEISETTDFDNFFFNSNAYEEIFYTTRILKCKYYKEALIIDINNNELAGEKLYTKLGLSVRTKNALRGNEVFYNLNAKEFFGKIKNPYIKTELMSIRCMGEVGRNEILLKASILINYYEEQLIFSSSQDMETALDKKTLEYLKAELKRLQEERNQIDVQIEMILTRLEEIIELQSTTGNTR